MACKPHQIFILQENKNDKYPPKRRTSNIIPTNRFLWVALQIESLCLEETDYHIREALQDLPKDLSATFCRILQRSKTNGRHSYQRPILGFLLAASRPLKISELREALAVVPGDSIWRPERQVNNMHHILTCCGSLVVVTEEECTVQFIHQSISQFLLDETKATSEWHFKHTEASLMLGEVCVTYLNYGVFDQKVSTRVVPKIPVGSSPTTVAQSTLRNAGMARKLALVFLKTETKIDPDIGRTVAETSRSLRRQQIPDTFEFLKYASENWLLHTKSIDDNCGTLELWQQILASTSRFDGLTWAPNEVNPSQLQVNSQLSTPAGLLSSRTIWAITHSHLPLLSTELQRKQGLKTLYSIVQSLRVWFQAGYKLTVDGAMCLKLFQISVLFRAKDVANHLLDDDQPHFDRQELVKGYFNKNHLEDVRWIISLDKFGNLEPLGLPIVEMACEAMM